jgi:hypothetical protein
MKIKNISIIIFGIILLCSCSNEKNSKKEVSNDKEVNVYSKEFEKETSDAYKQFKKIYNYIADDLNFEGYNDKKTNKNTVLVYVNKKVTFNEKEALTVNGKAIEETETQKDIVFYNEKEGKYIIIDVIYSENKLKNDLLYLQGLGDTPTYPQYDNTSTYLYSFNHSYLKLTVVDTKRKINDNDVIKIASNFVDFLEKLKLD